MISLIFRSTLDPARTSCGRRRARTSCWVIVEAPPAPEVPRVRFRHPAGSSHPSWRQGQGVAVLFDPAQTSEAIIDQGPVWNQALPLIPAVIGLVLLPLGLVALAARENF